MEDQKIAEILEELKKDTINTELIQDNKLHFDFEKEKYRVKMPDQKENAEAIGYKNKIYIKLIQEDNTLTIKQLTKILKEKGIDIEEFDKVAKKSEEEMAQIYLTLYRKKDSEKTDIEELKEKLDEVRNKRLEVVLEKAGYLAPAIENQVQDDYYRLMTSMCTEKLINKKEDKWAKVWDNWKDYEKDNTKFPYIALGKFSELMFGV